MGLTDLATNPERLREKEEQYSSKCVLLFQNHCVMEANIQVCFFYLLFFDGNYESRSVQFMC